MKTSGLTAITLVPLFMAAFSLVSMIGTLQIDKIVHGTLYNYGLEFSNQWAQPYWNMTAVVFTAGWFNIIAAIAFQVYVITYERQQAKEFEAAVKNEILKLNIQSIARGEYQFRRATESSATAEKQQKAASTASVAEAKTTEKTEVHETVRTPCAQEPTTSKKAEPAPESIDQQPEQKEKQPEAKEKKEERPIVVGVPEEELQHAS